MKTTSLRARALACALLTGTALCGLAAPASAQTSPTYRNFDSNGVDLVKGDFLTSFPEGSIGSGEAELALLRMLGATGSNGTQGSSQWDHILFNITSSGTYVDFGSRNDKFPGAESRGAALSGSGGSYQYRSPDGTVIAFTDPTSGGDVTNFCDGTTKPSCLLLPTTITSPDGKVVNINYSFWSLCITTGGGGGGPPYEEEMPDDPPPTTDCTHTPRIASVTNSYGYSIVFAYASAAGTSSSSNPPATFHQRTGATFYNSNAGSSSLASVSYSYPSTGVTDITDQGGRVWRVTSGSTNYAIQRPGASSNTTSASLSSGVVSSVTKEGVTTNYSRSVSGSTATMVVTNALSQATTIVSNLTSGRPTSVTDPLSHAISFTYDSSDRPLRVTQHEGNYVEHTYDARGNVTQTVAVPKSGSGATIVTSASFDSTCANPVTCNRPNSTTDARGNVTDYTYDSTHGGVLTVTAPAATGGGTRPQTRSTYTLTNGEYQVTEVSQCQTTSSCTGTADEVKTAIAYNPDGNVYSTATGNGSATLVATTTMTYDAIGNLVTIDGPLSGTADTSRNRYNIARQVIGSVSPDPDGGGALKHRAVRNTYDSSTGLLTKTEQGNVNSQSDTDWAAFSAAQATEIVYDSNARPIVGKLTSGSTVYALGQTSYDALGRAECSAQRMNPAVFGSTLPAACSLGTQGSGAGDYGPDRIAKSFYDSAGRAYQTKTALGTADETTDVTATFTANGQVETATDAENNKTTYEYDGHDRLSKTRYPSTTKGAGTSSTTDYEQPTYESLVSGTRTSGTVTAFRNRAAETIGVGHDALGRLISKDLPGTEPDATYGYDLLGRLLSAAQNGITIAFTYDALGRQLTQTIPIALIATPVFSSEWDLAGRRTRYTWPVDASSSTAYYVDYDYLVTGEMEKVREKGAASGAGVLATFGYDDLGRRTSLTRGNGATTAYSYDAVSRLGSMTHDFGGSATTHDLTLGFAYNPASQIVEATRSNDLYAWTGHGSGTTSSTTNGLNQLATHAGATATSDSKGNLTSDGTYTYAYSSENLLTSFGATGTLEYDPLMRFYRNYSTYFIHEGGQLVGDYYNGNIVARYVPGAAGDEPVAQIDKFGARTGFHADERGSIVAGSNATGANSRIVTYDEYGKRGPGGSYRFAYTGQVHLLNDIYDYKARNYNARLGRFLQMDPIGYGAGMNIYAYVGGDPINFTDPSGLAGEECPGSLSTSCGNDDRIIGYSARQYVDEYFKGVTSAVRDELIGYVEDFLSGTLNQDGLEKAIRGELPGWRDFHFSDQVNDIIVTGQQTANLLTDVFSFSGDLRRLSDFWGRGECGCLEAGTLVSTPQGLVPIETIKVGDLVISFNEATGEQAPRHVTDIIRPNPKSLYALATVDASGQADLFHATDDHPWKVVGKGWVETINLTAGDRIATGGGEPLTVVSLTDSGRNERTYNLTVAQWHTFMIGEERAVVHNACPPLRLLHPIETLTSGSNRFNYESWKGQATDFIVESLFPDADFPLLVDAAGLIWDGNTRISILKERRYPVDELPRTPK